STVGLENFTKINTYVDGQFSDVKSSDWFAENVRTVYELGLMNGNSATTFNPYGNITQAEALTITARIHKIYTTGNDDFSDIKQEMLDMEPEILEWCNNDKNSPAYKEFYNAWYAPYAYYLYAYVWGEGRGEYPQFPALAFSHVYAPFIETQEPMKRGILVSSLLLGSLPENEFNQINQVDNGAIPDLSYGDGSDIYMFYRAGILTGNDASGTFSFDSNITRAEVAAIIGRMVNPSLRKHITLRSSHGTSDIISASTYSLNLTDETTITITTTYKDEEYPGGVTLNANYDSSVINVKWEESDIGYWDNPLRIIPIKNGTTTLRISLVENPNEYQDVIVTVSGFDTNMSTPTDLTTLTIEGMGEEFKQYNTGLPNTNKLHSATYRINNYPNDTVAIWVDFIVSCTDCVDYNGYIQLRYNLYNSSGVVVKTGTTITEFTHTYTQYAGTLSFSSLPPDDYKLVFSSKY
ncbi:MAG: S-layer homology domain-containing protein, partial [Oscillospiraceae bacterium]|nr:S-layer homology domain-containing protein [Oscillospiraceae bacterium]